MKTGFGQQLGRQEWEGNGRVSDGRALAAPCHGLPKGRLPEAVVCFRDSDFSGTAKATTCARPPEGM